LLAEGAESRIDVPLDVPDAGRYEIVARIAQAPNYGDYIVLLDGKTTNMDNRQAATSEVPSEGPEVFHGYLPEVYVAVDRPLGWLALDKGRHTLSFVCVGKDSRSSGYNFGLNDVVLERIPEPASAATLRGSQTARSPATHIPGAALYRDLPLVAYLREVKHATEDGRADVLRAIGAFGPDAAPALNELAKALGDRDANVRIAAVWAFSQMESAGTGAVSGLRRSMADADPRVRSLSAVALRSIGPKAVDAVPELIQALNDPEAYVRAPAADALGSIGPGARAAVPALGERLLATAEQTYVLRSAAAALGNIGPDAAGALPVLQRALTMYRVKYTAQEAILKIKKEPVRAWF
jgi:hypothetical protein